MVSRADIKALLGMAAGQGRIARSPTLLEFAPLRSFYPVIKLAHDQTWTVSLDSSWFVSGVMVFGAKKGCL